MSEKCTSLYIHIPFCRRKCHYCSFSVSVATTAYIDRYLKCLDQEMRRNKIKKISSIYIGGGTPSLLSDEQIKILRYMIEVNFEFRFDCEQTVEFNPEDCTKEKIGVFQQAGFNRISLGLQTFDNPTLRFLGRRHTSGDNSKAIENCQKLNVKNISVDLMIGFPSQNLKQLRRDIKEIAQSNVQHCSVYQLGIEKESLFYIQKKKCPNENKQILFYRTVREFLERYRFSQYEVSNYARGDFASRHNMMYWKGGDYIGMGMAAHSRKNHKRFWNTSRLLDYLKKIESGLSPIAGHQQLNRFEQLCEALCFGLRMNRGVDLSELQERFQTKMDQSRLDYMKMLVQDGILEREGSRIRATPRGQLVCDEISARLI